MLVKAGLIAALSRLFGSPWPQALGLGVILSQGGEFGFVIFAAAASGLLISAEAADLFSAVVVLSMALTPLAVRLLPKPKSREDEDAAGLATPADAHGGKAIIVGYGRFGQAVGQMLMARGIELVLIDTKPSQIKTSAPFGIKIYYGDGRRPDVLRAAGAESADIIVFCVDGEWLDGDVIAPVRRAFPKAKIFARAFDRRHLLKLWQADVEVVVREVFDSGIRMGREALLALGTPPEQVAEVEAEYRRRDDERLCLQSVSGEMTTGKDMLFRPDNRFDQSAIGEIPFVEPTPARREAAE